jgi:hypothetical protein
MTTRNQTIGNKIIETITKHIVPIACPLGGDAMSVLEGKRVAMRKKRNVVLYIDKELIEESRELGFNLSKTFENHLKHLITQFSTGNSTNNFDSEIENAKWWAEPDLNRRPLARKANVLTKLDDRPLQFSPVPKLELFTLRFWSANCLDIQ